MVPAVPTGPFPPTARSLSAASSAEETSGLPGRDVAPCIPVHGARTEVSVLSAIRQEFAPDSPQDARAKAELYAETAGVKLGQVLLIQETSAPVPMRMMARMSLEAAAAVPIAPGQETLSVSITVTYGLE